MVVMYRTESGQVVALEDRCPHRNLPLSKGELVGPDRIQCGYHGLEFNPAGRCLYNPDTKKPVPWANVKSYAVEERNGWIYIWMGDGSCADRTTVPWINERMQTKGYDYIGDRSNPRCNYRYAIDNLLTISHVRYIHKAAGSMELVERAKRTVTLIQDPVMGQGVRLKHVTRDMPVSSYYSNLSGRMDRWFLADYYPPGYFYIRYDSPPAKPGELVMNEDGAWQILHAMTPETESSSHDFWAHVHQAGVYVGEAAEEFERQPRKVIAEDTVVYEAMQACVEHHGGTDIQPKGFLPEDHAFVESRRVLERRIEAEQRQTAAS